MAVRALGGGASKQKEAFGIETSTPLAANDTSRVVHSHGRDPCAARPSGWGDSSFVAALQGSPSEGENAPNDQVDRCSRCSHAAPSMNPQGERQGEPTKQTPRHPRAPPSRTAAATCHRHLRGFGVGHVRWMGGACRCSKGMSGPNAPASVYCVLAANRCLSCIAPVAQGKGFQQ